jgi:predicted nucleic acid-binding protein
MDLLVVDTDVVSFFFKNDPRAQPYVAHWTGKTLVVSFMTLAELKLWALVRNWGPARAERLTAYMARHFVVHPVDERLCGLWAAVMAQSRAQGKRLQTADARVAATALAIGAPLMTHNAKDFGAVEGLKLLNVSS